MEEWLKPGAVLGALSFLGGILASGLAWLWKGFVLNQTAQEALRRATAANARLDTLVREIKDRDGYAERITALEGDERRTQRDTTRARKTGHRAINVGAALFGYLDGAFDVLEEATGRKIARPKLRDLLKDDRDEDEGAPEDGNA